MKSNKQLVNNIIGQLRGISKMLDEEKDCLDVLIQLKAARSAIGSVTNKIIEERALNCFSGKGKVDKARIKKLIEELIKNN